MSKKNISILASCHNEWVGLVNTFGVTSYAEDIVQETYIKIMKTGAIKKAVVNGNVNRAFMYITLRNNVVSYQRSKGKIYKIQITDRIPAEDNNIDRHIALDIVEKKINEEINQWHWYDRDMFLHYLSSGISQRKIAKGSKISLSSISNTIVNCKNRIRDKVGEDIEDIYNNEYNRVKND